MRKTWLLCCFAMSGCATVTPETEAPGPLDAWVGHDAAELVAVLGEPDFRTDRLLTWRKIQPGMKRSPSAYATGRLRCGDVDATGDGSVGRRRCSNWALVHRSDTVIGRDGCRIYASLDNGVVTSVETHAVGGRCFAVEALASER